MIHSVFNRLDNRGTNFFVGPAVLHKLAQRLKPHAVTFQKTTVVTHFHHLPTTVALLASIRELCGNNSRTHTMGKFFSSAESAQQSLDEIPGITIHCSESPQELGAGYGALQRTVKNMALSVVDEINNDTQQGNTPNQLITITDGGASIEFYEAFKQFGITRRIPFAIVEQTGQGMKKIRDFSEIEKIKSPVIDIAGCALKRDIESAIIVSNMLAEIKKLLMSLNTANNDVVGIVGASGAIGKKLVQQISKLIAEEFPDTKIVAYNLVKNTIENVRWTNNLSDLVTQSTIILSATGSDITREFTRNELTELSQQSQGKKHFINLASFDEFESLLKHIQHIIPLPHDVLDDIHYGSIVVHSGGMPVNLVAAAKNSSGAQRHDHPDDFGITRALKLGGLFQAILLLQANLTDDDLCQIFQLSPSLQRFILQACKQSILARHPQLESSFSNLEMPNIIEQDSRGVPLPGTVEDQIHEALTQQDHQYRPVR